MIRRSDAQLIDGERRLRACTMAGKPFRAEVREAAGDEETFVASFAANFGKQDHDVIEIAEGLARMRAAGKSTEQLKRIAGKSDCWVIQHLNLLKLHPDVQAMMVSDDEDESAKLTFQVAQLLVPIADHDEQLRLAKKITGGEGMGIAAARRFVLRERASNGDKTAYTGSKGPRRSLAAVDSILEDTTNRIGVFIDMPGAELNRLIDSVDNFEKRKMIESIDDAIESLDGLKDAIAARLPKVLKRSA